MKTAIEQQIKVQKIKTSCKMACYYVDLYV